jgi:hypothetical protein
MKHWHEQFLLVLPHKVGHNFGFEHTKCKIKMCGPAPIIEELEQTIIIYLKIDVKILSGYHPMFCMEINVCTWHKIKLFTITLIGIVYTVIWGEPERAPNTRETGSGVYIYLFIYLCVILHSNDSMRMLRHHVLTVIGKRSSSTQ